MQKSFHTCLLACLILTGGSAMAADNKPFVAVDTLPRVATPHFNFITLVVGDADRALTFYTKVLGMQERGRAQPNREFFEIVVGYDMAPLAAGLSLTYRNGPPTPRGNGSSSVNLVVKNLAGIMAKVVAGGGEIVHPLTRGDLPHVAYSLARIRDPDGNALELVEYHRIGRLDK